MKPFYIIWAILLITLSSFKLDNTKYFTNTGHISFFSSTPVEDIEADNNLVSSVLNIQTGDIAFSLFIKDFKFDKKLMQEHFNENYLESDKYPKATFKGKIVNIESVNFGQDGVNEVEAEGELFIHNVAKKVKFKGTLELKTDNIKILSKFKIKLIDYNIQIPKIVFAKIAEEIEVSVDMIYNKLTK